MRANKVVLVVMDVISLTPINFVAHAVVVVVIVFIGCIHKFGCRVISTCPLLGVVIVGGPRHPCLCQGGVLRVV